MYENITADVKERRVVLRKEVTQRETRAFCERAEWRYLGSQGRTTRYAPHDVWQVDALGACVFCNEDDERGFNYLSLTASTVEVVDILTSMVTDDRNGLPFYTDEDAFARFGDAETDEEVIGGIHLVRLMTPPVFDLRFFAVYETAMQHPSLEVRSVAVGAMRGLRWTQFHPLLGAFYHASDHRQNRNRG